MEYKQFNAIAFCDRCNDFRGDGLEWSAFAKRGKAYCEKWGSEIELMDW